MAVVKPASESAIRSSFINCSKGDAKRMNLPRNLSDQRWADLDFLGWTDPQAPQRRYLVAERDAALVSIALHAGNGNARKSNMCDICLTTHPGGGVVLMVAPKAGAPGRLGNTVGNYLCADLDCSLYVRQLKTSELGMRIEESTTVDQRIDRLRSRLYTFLDRVAA